MTNEKFVLVSLAIFLINFFLSAFAPFSFLADLFVVWVLTVLFLDRSHKINLIIFIGLAIFFDFWSGHPFGTMTIALLLIILIIFLIKKVLLIDHRSNLNNFIWLIGFYCLYSFGSALVLPRFGILDWLALGLLTAASMAVVKKLSQNEKRVSGFEL